MKQATRIRLIKAAFGADGKPSMYRAVVMSGAKAVASTSNVKDAQVALCLAEALRAAHNVSQRAQ